MGCAKKKMAKGGMVKRRKVRMIPGYATGGAIAPPMTATDEWNANVGVPDPTMYRNDAKNMANVASYIKEQGGSVPGQRQKPMAADVLGKFQAGQSLDGMAEQTTSPVPQTQPAAPTPPRRQTGGLGINLDNSMGLSTLSAPSTGLSGSSPAGIATGLGQDQSPLSQYQRGGAAMDYRQGGPVAGGPPGVDTVPAMLNNGEYVLPRPTTQAMGGKPALDQAVLATTGKPPVGYAQGGMPVRSTYDQLRLRGQDVSNAVDRMTSPPPSPQGFSVPQQSAQARTRPAPVQPPGAPVLGGGMPGVQRQYADGGRVSGWNVDRAAQIENAVNGAMGQSPMQAAPVAPPPAVPEMQLSEGEQYMLEQNRAREAAAAQASKPAWKKMLGFADGGQVPQAPSRFETLLRAMTGKPAGYAMGGEVQGYVNGGMPWQEPDKKLVGNFGPLPPVVQEEMKAAADIQAQQDAVQRERTARAVGAPVAPPSENTEVASIPVMPPSAPQLQPHPQRLEVAPEYQKQVGQAILTNQNEADTAKNLNLGANIAPKPPLPASRMRNSLGITPEAFNQTGGGFLGTVGGAPAGVDDAEYAKMSPAQKSAAKVKSMNEAAAAIRETRNARREAEGSPPVGGWARYLLDQQKQAKGAEANQELYKDAFKVAAQSRANQNEEAFKANQSQDKDFLTMLDKYVPEDDGASGGFTRGIMLQAANMMPDAPATKRIEFGMSMAQKIGSPKQLRATAIARLKEQQGMFSWGDPPDEAVASMVQQIIDEAMGRVPTQPPAPPPR